MNYAHIAAVAVEGRVDTPSPEFAAGLVLGTMIFIATLMENWLKKKQKLDNVLRVFLAVALAGLVSLIPLIRRLGRGFYNDLADYLIGKGMSEAWAEGSASVLGLGVAAIAIGVWWWLEQKPGFYATAWAYTILFVGLYSFFQTQVGRQFVDAVVQILGVHVWNFFIPGGAPY